MIQQPAGSGLSTMNDHLHHGYRCPQDSVDERTKEVLDKSQRLLDEARNAVEEARRLIERTSHLIHDHQACPRKKEQQSVSGGPAKT